MRLFKGSIAIILFSMLSFAATLEAKPCTDWKFGNFSECKITLFVGVQNDDGTTFTIGPIFLAPGDIYYDCLPEGQKIYKFGINGNSILPPNPGECVKTGWKCPKLLCDDSVGAYYVE